MAIEIPGVGPVASNAIVKKINDGGELQGAALTSAGGNITIPVGSTVWEALQIIIDAADPDLG